MRQFPFSERRSGIEYVSIQPVSWTEATVLERRFRPGVPPQEAVSGIEEFLHSDYAYVFEAYWDLWAPGGAPETVQVLSGEEQQETWSQQPALVRFVAYGLEFDEEAFQQEGHIQVELGQDTPFLHEDTRRTAELDARIRDNVQKLVAFTAAVEKNCGVSGRLLWSESEENLAQKLIARLQDVQ